MKRCPDCKETKPRTEFVSNRARRDGLSTYCRLCTNDRQRRRPPVEISQRQIYHLRGQYGLEAEDYERMLTEQGGNCAICENPETTGRRLAVDYCHATGGN